jgi:hypothetical protein
MVTVKEETINPVTEAVKEPLRYIELAVVSFLLTEGILNSLISLIFGARLSPELVLLITGILTSVLRGYDKFLHETAKAEPTKDNQGLLGVKGLTGF